MIVQNVTKKKYFILIKTVKIILIRKAVYSLPLANNNILIQTKKIAKLDEILSDILLGCKKLLSS